MSRRDIVIIRWTITTTTTTTRVSCLVFHILVFFQESRPCSTICPLQNVYDQPQLTQISWPSVDFASVQFYKSGDTSLPLSLPRTVSCRAKNPSIPFHFIHLISFHSIPSYSHPLKNHKSTFHMHNNTHDGRMHKSCISSCTLA